MLVSVWQDALDGYTYDEALAALREHIKISTYPAVPAHIIEIAKRQRHLTRRQREQQARADDIAWLTNYVQILDDPPTDQEIRDNYDWNIRWRAELEAHASEAHYAAHIDECKRLGIEPIGRGELAA